MKNCITIGPGGALGLYMLGTMSFIKHNYNIDNFHIGGASAGAHVALYALSSNSDVYLYENIVDPLLTRLNDRKHYDIGQEILNVYNQDTLNVDYRRAFVSVSSVKLSLNPVSNIIMTDFNTLEDFTEAVMFSSFVPILFGQLGKLQDRTVYFDGAATDRNPILKGSVQTLHITPSMWGRTFDNSQMWNFNSKEVLPLVKYGYMDARKNRHILDKTLKRKNIISRSYNKVRISSLLRKVESANKSL